MFKLYKFKTTDEPGLIIIFNWHLVASNIFFKPRCYKYIMSALTHVTSFGGHIVLKQMTYTIFTKIHLDEEVVIE